MSSEYSDSFTYSFLIWMPFISFSCLIALARTSNTMLNESVKSRHPPLVPDLRGKAFSFSPLNTILAMDLSYLYFDFIVNGPTRKLWFQGNHRLYHKSSFSEDRKTWICILSPPHSKYMTLRKFLDLCKPQFSHLSKWR